MREKWRKGGGKGKWGESERQKEERGGDGKREYRGIWGQGRGQDGKTARKLA